MLPPSSGHIMPFGWDIYGYYIYSTLTVTHAQRAFRNLVCWLGIVREGVPPN